jgi:hypothetical protein
MVAAEARCTTFAASVMKLKHHIGSIVFLVAAVASAAYGVVAERGADGRSGVRDGDENRVFTSFDRGALTAIDLTRDDGALSLVRARAPDAFHMTRPEMAATDTASVDQLVAALELATVVRRVDEAPAAAGAKPRARGTLTFGARTLRFTLGGPAPVPEGASYLDVEGAGTVVVARELASELLRPFDAYRDRTLVPMPVSDIVRFEVEGPDGALVLERLDEASFRVPGGPRASREVTDRFTSAVPELRAVTFVRDVDAKSLAASSRSLTLTGRDGRSLRVRFGGSCPGDPPDVLAVVEGDQKLAACVPSSIAAAFDVAPATVVDRRLFLAHPDEASELVIEASNGAALSIARVGNGFRERRPRARELGTDESEIAAALLARVLAVSGAVALSPLAGATEPAKAGRAPAGGPIALRIAVGRAGTEAEEHVEIVDVGSAHFAHRVADGQWLALSAGARRVLEPPAGGIRAQPLVGRGFTTDSASRITVHCGAMAETLVRSDGSFAFETPRGLPADTARALALVELVEKTRGREAEQGGARPNEGCTLSVGWTADGGTLESTLTFRPLDDDAGPSSLEVLARREGEPGWLAVDGALERAVDEPLVDRSALAWDVGDGERIEIVRAPAANAAAASPEEAAPWKTALRDLRALRVERLGPTVPEEGFARPLVELRLGREGGAPVVMRFAHTKTAGELFARRSDLDVTFRIAADAIPVDRR